MAGATRALEANWIHHTDRDCRYGSDSGVYASGPSAASHGTSRSPDALVEVGSLARSFRAVSAAEGDFSRYSELLRILAHALLAAGADAGRSAQDEANTCAHGRAPRRTGRSEHVRARHGTSPYIEKMHTRGENGRSRPGVR
jgi:hypothetical protein